MKSRLARWAIATVAVIVIGHFVVSMFFPWSPVNCRHQEVDITTGQLRLTRYLLFCKVSERTEPSPLSKVLPPDMIAEATPEWHRVSTFSPGVHNSPHYLFHGAIHQIHTLASIWEMSEMSEDLKRKTALHVLALWQHNRNDYLADYYIHALYDLMEEETRQQILSVLPTLTIPRIETNGATIARTVFFPNGQPMDRIHGYLSSSGEFIRHGAWEQWRSDGTLSLYGNFDEDDDHGRRFEWDRDGKLMAIGAFNRGQLSEYESKNLEQHPDYEVAQQLRAQDEPKPRP